MRTDRPLSVRDVADELSLSVWTVRALIKAGAIRGARYGKVFRVPRTSLDEFKRGAQVRVSAA
jgi:excisionase family DNA binding protein